MDDVISRKAAIDALEKVAELFPWRVPGNRDSYDRYNEAWNDAIGRAEIEIEELPSAPQRTGRWIHDGYAFKGGIDWMHCSECGHKDSWSVATRTPFCAWCGARMEDPEDIPMEYFENGGR